MTDQEEKKEREEWEEMRKRMLPEDNPDSKENIELRFTRAYPFFSDIREKVIKRGIGLFEDVIEISSRKMQIYKNLINPHYERLKKYGLNYDEMDHALHLCIYPQGLSGVAKPSDKAYPYLYYLYHTTTPITFSIETSLHGEWLEKMIQINKYICTMYSSPCHPCYQEFVGSLPMSKYQKLKTHCTSLGFDIYEWHGDINIFEIDFAFPLVEIKKYFRHLMTDEDRIVCFRAEASKSTYQLYDEVIKFLQN